MPVGPRAISKEGLGDRPQVVGTVLSEKQDLQSRRCRYGVLECSSIEFVFAVALRRTVGVVPRERLGGIAGSPTPKWPELRIVPIVPQSERILLEPKRLGDLHIVASRLSRLVAVGEKYAFELAFNFSASEDEQVSDPRAVGVLGRIVGRHDAAYLRQISDQDIELLLRSHGLDLLRAGQFRQRFDVRRVATAIDTWVVNPSIVVRPADLTIAIPG